MKKILALFITTLTAVILSVSVSAETAVEELSWNYAVKNDGTAVIMGYTGFLWGDVEIPSEIDGYKVTEIDEYCFKDDLNSFGITIPGTIKTIPDKAFSGCYGLNEVIFSEGVEMIGEYAFLDCYGLQRVSLPESIKTIGSYAFTECSYLEEIKLPDGLTELGQGVFSYCTYLKRADLGNGIRNIPIYTFYNCSALESVVIGKSTTYISYNAFDDCTSLKTVFYEGSRSEWKDMIMGNCEAIDDSHIICNVTDEYLEENYYKEPDKSTEYLMIAVYAVIVLAGITVVVILILRKKKTCPGCGAVPEEGEKFCVKCGTKL